MDFRYKFAFVPGDEMRLISAISCLLAASGLLVSPTDSAAMDFEFARSGDQSLYIRASGPIESETGYAFEAFVDRHQVAEGLVVVLNSPGGDVAGGIALGEAIRGRGFSTFVSSVGECLSACAFAFVGGADRAVAGRGRLGVHQFRWAEVSGSDTTGQTQAISGVLFAYFRAMGVDTEVAVKAMLTPASEMYVFSPAELDAYRLVTSQVSAAPKDQDCPFPPSHKVMDPLRLYPGCTNRY